MAQEINTQTQLDTPILFVNFNRPEITRQTFVRIRQARPKQLFFTVDGPRAGREGEAEKVAAVREIVESVDWDCEVKTLFREKNLGCKLAVSGAIAWFFEHVEAGIILEDDCLPDPSFFYFCQQMLKRYANDERVMHISGDNLQNGVKRGSGSYYFSRYVHIWGWATWRRAWQKYDVRMPSYPEFKQQGAIKQLFTTPAEQQFWLNNFDNVYYQGLDTWDYQWVYTVFTNNGLAIMPNVNLISNIGFNAQGTHTTNPDDQLSRLAVGQITQLTAPESVAADTAADAYTLSHIFGVGADAPVAANLNIIYRVGRKIVRKLKSIV